MSASVGLMAAVLVLGLSSAPGWRELRWFAACAACAALFNLTNVSVTLPVDDATQSLLARVSMFFAGLHTASWYLYTSARRRARPSRFDRALVAACVVLAAASLVPGVINYEEVVPRAVPWLGIVYRDMKPTPFGQLIFGFHTAALSLVFARFARRWRAGEVDAAAHAIGLGAVILGAGHDSLADSAVIDTPYLLAPALLILVLSVGGSLVSRFVITARALEESSRRLAMAQEELVARERLAAIGELAAVIAHEVRNPLAVVFNAIAALRKVQPGSADQQSLLGIAQEEAERLRDLVSELLDFAKPQQPHFASVDVAELVRAAVDAARGGLDASTEEVHVETTGDLASFECDPRLVRQAVVNLVTNALQAESRSSPVDVTVEAGRDALTLLVRDDGEGVPDERRGRIFEPFFTTRATGTGLGLAVVQRCADAHGGTVELAAPNGRRGATFSLRLPRAGRSERPPSPASSARPSS